MWLKTVKTIKNKLSSANEVYLDNAASTPTDAEVLKQMHEAQKLFANPSSIHKLGLLARKKIDESRRGVADFIRAHADEVVFTASGTESDNLAIMGVISKAVKNGIKTPHIIVTSIEHSAVIGLVQKLESENKISATYLNVDENGLIDVKSLKDFINENTVLISVHLVNNEIGTLLPIKEVVKFVRTIKKQTNNNQYPLIHTDACQATPYFEINVNQLGVDLMTFNGQKMYGPKGIGVLFIKRNTPIEPVFIGGNQEFGLRPGTESVALIAGLAKACQITKQRQNSDFVNLTKLRKYFIESLEGLQKDIDIKINIYAKNVPTSPHILNISFDNIFSEVLVLYFDSRGIYVSSKSACKTDDPNESYVLKALKYAKIDEQELGSYSSLENGSIRFSMGRDTTKHDIDYVIKNLKEILDILKIPD